MSISWGTLFIVVGMLIFFALAIDLFDVKVKGIDWNFLAHGLVWLGVLLSGIPLTLTRIVKKG